MFEAGGFFCDLNTLFFRGFEVSGHVDKAGCLVHPSIALEVIDEGAEIEIDGAADAAVIVAEHVFGVDEAGFVFVDFDAAFDEGEIV